jgi:putative oxidoreductase
VRSSTTSALAPLILRAGFGFGMVHHGFHNALFDDHHRALIWNISRLGVPGPEVVAWTISILVFVGGIAIVVGAWVRAACIGLSALAWLSIILIHAPQGYDFMRILDVTGSGPQFALPGYEVPVLYITGFLALYCTGSGGWSVDAHRARTALPVIAPERPSPPSSPA